MRVLILTAMYPTPENPAFGSFVRTQVECLRRHGVEVELLVLDGRPRKLIYPRGVVQLRQRLSAAPVDLVHAHYSYVGMVARTQWRVPVVVTYHGSDLLGARDPDGQLLRHNRVTVPAGRALAHVVDAAIVQSHQMAALLNGTNVHVIPHEIDFETFQPTERSVARVTLGLHPETRYLLFAARPDNGVKNFPLARAAADALHRDDANVELLVVHKEPQDRLALYMSASDALVFPSLSEGSPNVVKQAMACNLPIVATDVGDIREVIDGTEWCFVCQPTVADIAGRLGEILAHRPRTSGRAAVAHFNEAAVAQRIIGVYQQVTRNTRPVRRRADVEALERTDGKRSS